MPHIDDPYISVEMYNLAISLIQSFDEMEGKDSRGGLGILTDLMALTNGQTHKVKIICVCV